MRKGPLAAAGEVPGATCALRVLVSLVNPSDSIARGRTVFFRWVFL